LILVAPDKVGDDAPFLAHSADSAHALHVVDCGFGKFKLDDMLHIASVQTSRGKVVADKDWQLLVLEEHQCHSPSLNCDVDVVGEAFDFSLS
jgi:hypothetical protein